MHGRRVLVLGSAGLLVSFAVSAAMSAGAAPPAGTPPSKAEIAKQIRFGTEMAQQGNWHEAIFRWRRALASDPDNPRLHNNIAVAYESLGQYDKADSEYRAAAAIPGAPDEIARNRDLFEKFYMRYREAVPARAADAPGPPPPPASSPPLPPASSPPPSATVPPPPAEAPTEKPKEPDAKAP